jgi:hypothetical protein
MAQQKRIGDSLDYLSLDAIGLVISVLVERTPAKIRGEKRKLFAGLPGDKVAEIDEQINPLLADLRKTILAAYNPETQQIDSSVVSRTLTEKTVTVAEKLKDVFKEDGMISDDTAVGMTAGLLVAIEATLALKEPVPAKGRRI